jgi:hypothetical protein
LPEVPIKVYLESTPKRVFASAAEWPGWCRSGKDEAAALEALASSGSRYAAVAKRAGLTFKPAAAKDFKVLERLPGSATTDFGAPGAIAKAEAKPLTTAGADRLEALLRACWKTFDEVVRKAPPELRKGPRGGGRDRDQIASHVIDAEGAYASRIGVRLKPPAAGDPKAVAEWRDALVTGLRPSPEATAAGGGKRWPPAYAARRIAWHALDHAWEIEDRTPEG